MFESSMSHHSRFNLSTSNHQSFFFGFVCPQCRSANLLESSLIPKQQLPLIVDPGVLRHVTHPKNSTLSPMDVVVVGLINLTWRHRQTWKEVIRTLQVVYLCAVGIHCWLIFDWKSKKKQNILQEEEVARLRSWTYHCQVILSDHFNP